MPSESLHSWTSMAHKFLHNVFPLPGALAENEPEAGFVPSRKECPECSLLSVWTWEGGQKGHTAHICNP